MASRSTRCGCRATHTHRREDETFYVLEGAVTVWVGDRRGDLLAGDRAFLPRGIAHGYRVDDGGARLLNICTPGGLGGFFDEVMRGATLVAIAERYGITYA